MEAIVLAGGLGTRLRHIISDVPKPMAPVNGIPFLCYIFDSIINNGVSHIILAVGYKAEIIKHYFGDEYKGIKITYSFENSPLGTGGAIKNALSFCKEENIYIINGDTFFDVDLNKMRSFHMKNKSIITIAVKYMLNCERYGTVILEGYKIKKFIEKKYVQEGIINCGIYIINMKVIDFMKNESFSFEKEILESGIIDSYAFESNGYFIDIGIPEDYYTAQIEFKNFMEEGCNNEKSNFFRS